MIIRYNGHDTGAMLVSNDGQVLRKFNLNHSPNHTGMEVVYWNGPHDGTDVGLWRLVPFSVVEKREALGNKEEHRYGQNSISPDGGEEGTQSVRIAPIEDAVVDAKEDGDLDLRGV